LVEPNVNVTAKRIKLQAIEADKMRSEEHEMSKTYSASHAKK
jgi:hypothetical protein